MDLQGHRGARGDRPENTKSAFVYAFEQGMTTLELDVALTADNYLVIHHDVYTNPDLCTDQDGMEILKEPIRSVTLAKLQLFNCGSSFNPKFPNQVLSEYEQLLSLEDFFVFIVELEETNPNAQSLRFNVELKFQEDATAEDISSAASRAVQVVTAANMIERTTIQSFLLPSLTEVRKQEPNIQLSALFMPNKREMLTIVSGANSKQQEILDQTIRLGFETISPHHLYVDANFVQQAHRANVKVVPWTVNDASRMLDLMNLGVDGIISDYPKLLKETHQQYLAQQQQ